MELNKIKSNFMPLLMNSIKGKRNWYFISTIIILVTTLLVPAILKADAEFFVFFGIVELFIMVYLNCLIDNSFLHSDSKLAYYLSKPASLKRLITVSIVSNLIFTCFLLFLSVISMVFHSLPNEIYYAYYLIIPWLITGILLSALSSVLTGNTIMAGLMTIFNFVLPWILYVIIMFVFSIVENIVLGFSADVLMETFTSVFYKLDYLYFIKYVEKGSFDIYYLLILIVIIAVLLFILSKCMKRRKNENTGNFMVFDGYKYFVSLLASLILPAAFTSMSPESGVTGKIFISIVLAILSYYIIIAVLEKSFRISFFSIKLFAVFMMVFIIITSTTVLFANNNRNFVPKAEDVKMAYVGNNTYAIRQINNNINENTSDIKYQYERTTLFKEVENIKNITELHKELLTNQNYGFEESYYSSNIVISYWMKDGSYIMRSYKLNVDNENSDDGNKNKDVIAEKIINSKELKNIQYSYLYDENYYKNKTFYIDVVNNKNGNVAVKNMNLNNIREYLIKDVDASFVKSEDAFRTLIYSDIFYGKEAIEVNENSYYLEIREETNNGVSYFNQIYLNDDFKNTKEFLNLK